MIAAIVDTTTLGKVIVYSIGFGVGISVIFTLGVSSAAGLLDAVRERRTTASVAWGALAAACLVGTVAVVVLGIAAMAAKG